MEYKCYRVWFRDGAATLVDARNTNEARQIALANKQKQAQNFGALRIRRVECLTEEQEVSPCQK